MPEFDSLWIVFAVVALALFAKLLDKGLDIVEDAFEAVLCSEAPRAAAE